MSTSQGNPSNKIRWYRSMKDKIKHQKLKEELAKQGRNPNKTKENKNANK